MDGKRLKYLGYLLIFCSLTQLGFHYSTYLYGFQEFIKLWSASLCVLWGGCP